MYIFWSRFVYVAIYGYLYKSGLIVLLNYFRLCFCVCWVYGSATLPGTSHYLDRGEGMLTLRGVRGVTKRAGIDTALKVSMLSYDLNMGHLGAAVSF